MAINYSRQQAIQGLTIPQTISVLGAGGLGTWTAYLAAISGVEEIHIFTPDMPVRDFDIARFPFPPSAEGRLRGEALTQVIHSVRPDCKVIVRPRFQHKRDERLLNGTVFNCAADTDEFDKAIFEYCEANGLKYFTGAYRGDAGGIAPGLQLQAPPQPTAVPSWPPVLAFVATMMLHAASVKPFTFFGPPHSIHLDEAAIGQIMRPLGVLTAR